MLKDGNLETEPNEPINHIIKFTDSNLIKTTRMNAVEQVNYDIINHGKRLRFIKYISEPFPFL